MSPIELTARSIRPSKTPISAATSSGRSPGASRCSRGLEDEDNRQSGRSERVQAPALVRPDLFVVGRLAAPAVHSAFSVARLFLLDRRPKSTRRHLAFEREAVPFLEGWHAQRVLDRARRASREFRARVHDANGVKWPESFYELKRGVGCPMCAQGRPEETAYGVRILSGEVSDAYLQRAGVQRGYSIVIWRGRHVAEPTELGPDEAAAYWRELLRVGRALEERFEPVKLNYELLGTRCRTAHARHAALRGRPQSRAGRSPPEDEPAPHPEPELRSDVEALRALLP